MELKNNYKITNTSFEVGVKNYKPKRTGCAKLAKELKPSHIKKTLA